MRHADDSLHPSAAFAYFAAVIACSMLFLHPVYVTVGFVCASACNVVCRGWKPYGRTLLFGLPFFLLIAVINPLVGGGGRTLLFEIPTGPVTWEALLYGLCSGGVLLVMLLWFAAYSAVVTPEKFLYLFSRAAPAASLLITATQRMIPLFTRRAQAVTAAQKTLLCDAAHGNARKRFQNGLRITSVLMSWSMEEGLDTADSMKARGYGAAKRTFFPLYHFRPVDAAALVCVALCLCVCLAGYYTGKPFAFYPVLVLPPFGLSGGLGIGGFALLGMLPVLRHGEETVRWRLSISKI